MSVKKFGRNYRFTFDPADGQGAIVIQPPFTIRFWVKRDILASVNNASIDIYNLSKANRQRMFQDRYNLGSATDAAGNVTGPRSGRLEVGYGNELYTIWAGNILTASSAREGVDIVTRIESLTGIYDLASSFVNTTLPAGSTLTQVFKTLIGQLPTLSYGFVSNFDSIVFPRGAPLNGNTWEVMKQYAQGQGDLFIDNNKVYMMLPQDKLTFGSPNSVPVLDSASGILETPRREQTNISITTLLEPSIQVNSIVQVKSVVEPTFNRQYSVIGLQHTGIISGAVSGDARSTFWFLQPSFLTYNQVQSA